MKRLMRCALTAAVVCGGMVAWLKMQPVSAADENQTVLQADHVLLQAIAKGDKAAAEVLLDAEFTCTDLTGKTQTKTEVLQNLNALATENDSETKLRYFDHVMLVTGTHRIPSQKVGVRYLRAWVKRPAGWRALVYQETKIAEQMPEHRQGFGSPSGGAPVDCDNPCKSVPYKPEGAAEQEVVAMWQGVERTVLTNDVDAWIPNFTDDFLFVTPDGAPPLNKADRVAMIKKLKRTNTVLIPARVESMRVWVLGNSAVMRSEHKPRSGRTLHVTRVFVKREDRWQITFGQQTAVGDVL